MAAIPSQKSGASILKDFKDTMTQRTGINNYDSDSKARSLIDSFKEAALRINEDNRTAHKAGQLSSAEGDALINFGTSRGISKLAATVARVTPEELNLAFYVESGTFGDINGGSSIVLDAGETIYSEANNNELGTRIEYKLSEAVTLPSGEGLVYVGAVASTTGTIGNVGHGVLREHNFTDYTDSANNTLKVINFYPILNGQDEETDTQYRFRIAQNYNRLHQNSDARILLTSLRVPGVLEVKPISGYYGIGTVGVVVLGADFQSNQSLVEAVQSRLNRYNGPAGKMIAVPAAQTLVDLELSIKTSRALNPSEVARLNAQIRRIANNYFRSVGLGGIVSFVDLAKRIHQDTNRLVVLQARGSEKTLYKNIYIRRGLANSIYSEKELIINDTHVLDEDEFADLGLLSIELE